MADVSGRLCFHHPEREAAAKCLECGRFFCRECITEHEDRVVCASCLESLSEKDRRKTSLLSPVINIIRFSAALALIWFFFFLLGKGLLLIPASFHEGTVWKTEETEK